MDNFFNRIANWINPVNDLNSNTKPGFAFSLPSGSKPVEVPNPQRGILISGGQGSGKTRSLIEPIVWQCAQKGFAGILYDYESPTLTQHVYSAYQTQSEVKNYYVNFSDLRRSHRLNPLDPTFMTVSAYAKDFSDTILSNLASEFIKNPNFFTRSAKSMLSAVIWYLREEKPDYCTLPHAVRMVLSKDTPKLLQRLSENDEVQGMIASIETGAASPNQNAGVVGTLQNIISDLNTPNIAWVLSGKDLTLDLNNPNQKKFLSVANTPQITNTLSPVISLIFSSALAQMNQQGKSISACIIDELPRIFIPNLDSIPATARKNLMAVILALQDFAQLEDKYGEKKAEVILSVLANQFFGKTTNPKTAERVSKLFGKYDKEMRSVSTPQVSIFDFKNHKTKTVTSSTQQRARVEPQEVVDLSTGQFFFNLVESWKNTGKASLKEHSYKASPMPEFADTSQDEVKANFKRISEEAQAIIEGNL
jgi:type IV secretory pathway TraG/TraD family ATPase VirD4